MNIRINISALVFVAVLAAGSTPVFAQTEGEQSSGKTYKRKLYSGKDADKYRNMDLPAAPDGRRRGEHDAATDAPAKRSRREKVDARKTERVEQAQIIDKEGTDLSRRERDEEAAGHGRDGRETETRERKEEKETSAATEGRANNDHSTYRSAERGSRKETRRSARREKWNRDSDGQR